MFSARGEVPNRLMRVDQGVPPEPQEALPPTQAQEGAPLQGPGTYCMSMSLTMVQGESCCRPQPPSTRLSEWKRAARPRL